MKKLAIVGVLVVAGCSRQAVVTSAPAPAPTPSVNATGGSTPREALQKFMAAAKSQDLQAMANVWGTSNGPVATDRRFMTVEDMEKRLIVMMRCLRHDSYVIRGETPAPGGNRILAVQVTRGTLTPSTDFTATLGPQARWYVLQFEPKDLDPICIAR